MARGEFDLFVGPSSATYYYNWTYTYGVYGTISSSQSTSVIHYVLQSSPFKIPEQKSGSIP